MHYSFIYFLLLLFAAIDVRAGPTLVITGSVEKNVAKINLLKKYIVGFEHIVDNFDSEIVILNAGNEDSVDYLSQFSQHFPNINFVGGISTAIFLEKPILDLKVEGLQLLEMMLRTERALYVVDFESNASESYLEKTTRCHFTSRAHVNESNTAYICNHSEVHETIPFIEELNVRPDLTMRNEFSFKWSGFYAEAAKAEQSQKKRKNIDSVEKEHIEDEIQEIVEKAMKDVEKRKKNAENDDDDDDDDDDNEFDNKHDPKRDHRLHCKYRKSCYETGQRGLIEKYDFSIDHIFHFWRAPESQQHHLSKHEDADQDGIPDTEDEDVNLSDRKLVCKYRPSCYKKHDIPLSDKLQERERSFMSAKLAPPQGKKRTLKEIAAKAVSGVEKREDEAKTRPLPKSLIVEQKLKEIDEHLNKKLDCKYRKSCYETGELPEIEESSISIPFVNFGFLKSEGKDEDDVDEEPKKFEEMEDLERKHYCKYRKSCYESGEKPDIEPEFQVESIRDIFEAAEQVETRKLTVQERCKYRKSCYETGILPDFGSDSEHIEQVARKEVSSVVPSTVQDLKTLCKYRKSCYQEIAVSQSPDIVQTIRKRRIIEKEVRKRRTRRHRRLHKRRHIVVKYGMRVNEHVEKTQKEIQEMENERVIRKKDSSSPTTEKLRVNEKTKGKTREVAEDIAEKVVAQKIVEAVAESTKEGNEQKQNNIKKSSENDDDDDDDDLEPKSEEKPKKVSKKIKASKKSNEEKSRGSMKKIVKRKENQKPADVEDDENDDDDEETPEPKVEMVHTSKQQALKKSEEKVQKVEVEEKEEDDDDEDDDEQKKPKPSEKNTVESEENDENDEHDEIEKTVHKIVDTPSKNSQKPMEAVKTGKHAEEAADENDDEDGNEFDNKHDPKRDHRLHCKYRKSCYETGERGMIEPFDFTIDHIFHFWRAPPSQQHHDFRVRDSDGDGVPDHEDKDTRMVDRKLLCKYRPTCYAKYDIPIEEKTLERESRRSEESLNKKENVDDDDDEDDNDEKGQERIVDLNGPDHRLGCKYRKSCYDSGVLPTIQQWSEAPTLAEAIESSDRDAKFLKCKYRKSCYEKIGIAQKDDEETIAEKEEVRKPHLKEPAVQKKEIKDQEHKNQKSEHKKHSKKSDKEKKKHEQDEDGDDNDDEHDKKGKKNADERKTQKIAEEIQRQENVHDKETEKGSEVHIDAHQKYNCKYRKSCYATVEPKASKQDHSGTMARRAGSDKKCHIYYLSCREAMGLPPKEKAPIGPNGKRLCRKVSNPAE